MKHYTMAAGAALLLGMAGATRAEPMEGPSIGVEAAYEDYGDGADDLTYGVTAGWDHAFGDQWLVGGGLRATLSGLDYAEEDRTPTLITRTRIELDDQWGLYARIGRKVAEQWMVYVQIEYEMFDLNVTETERSPVCAPPGDCELSRTEATFSEHLWSAGLGLEWAATEQLRLRAVYSYGERDSLERHRAGLTIAWKF